MSEIKKPAKYMLDCKAWDFKVSKLSFKEAMKQLRDFKKVLAKKHARNKIKKAVESRYRISYDCTGDIYIIYLSKPKKNCPGERINVGVVGYKPTRRAAEEFVLQRNNEIQNQIEMAMSRHSLSPTCGLCIVLTSSVYKSDLKIKESFGYRFDFIGEINVGDEYEDGYGWTHRIEVIL